MAFRYRLTDAGGEDAGDFETVVPDWRVGDIFRAGDGRHRHLRTRRIGSLREFVA